MSMTAMLNRTRVPRRGYDLLCALLNDFVALKNLSLAEHSDLSALGPLAEQWDFGVRPRWRVALTDGLELDLFLRRGFQPTECHGAGVAYNEIKPADIRRAMLVRIVTEQGRD